MKARNGQIDFSEMAPYRLGRHWNTIQTYLIPGIEDDIGELSEELKTFMEICELLIDERMFDKYRSIETKNSMVLCFICALQPVQIPQFRKRTNICRNLFHAANYIKKS